MAESQSSFNNKISNIDHYLAGVQRDLSLLADQQQLLRQEKQQWEESALRQIEQTENKLRMELAEIERQIKRRDEKAREAVEKIQDRIRYIQDIQNQCGSLISQLNKRMKAVQEILGGS